MERKKRILLVNRNYKLTNEDWEILKRAQNSFSEPRRSRMKFIRKKLKESSNSEPLVWANYPELREHCYNDIEKFNAYLRSIDSRLRIASLTRGDFNCYQYRFYK